MTAKTTEITISKLPAAAPCPKERLLKDSEYVPVGREAVQAIFERSGISPESTVIVYGYAPAYGYWLLKAYGHADVRILNCSRDTWRELGLPWTSVVSSPIASSYSLPESDSTIRASVSDVQAAVSSSRATLLDVRSEPEYQGERFWPSGGMDPIGRAGHIPGARHVALDGVFDERGAFNSRDQLRRVMSHVDLLGDDALITYCTIGGRAATAWYALSELLGRRNVRVYDGSWAQWGRRSDTAVEAAASAVAQSV